MTTHLADDVRLFIWTEDQKHHPVWTESAHKLRGVPIVVVFERPVSKTKLAEVFNRTRGMETTPEELRCYLLPEGGLVEDPPRALRDSDNILLRGGACGSGTRQKLREVTVQTKILGISRIDTVAQTFYADFVVVLAWVEERLVGISEDRVDWNLVFHPLIDVRNAFELEELTNFGDQGLTRLRSTDGQVTAVHRFKGVLSQPMELKAFPFDTQHLNISIGTKGQNTSEVILKPYGGAVVLPPDAYSSLLDWKLLRCDQKAMSTDPAHALHQSVYSVVQVRVQAARLPAFYVINIVAVLFGIVSISFVSFVFAPEAVSDRLNLNCTLLLTAVGFKAYVAETLPRISLLTTLDCYIIGMFSFLYFVGLENASVYLVARFGDPGAALVVDRIGLVASVALFVAFHVWMWSWVRGAQERDKLAHSERDATESTLSSAYSTSDVLSASVPGKDSPVARLRRKLTGVSLLFLGAAASGGVEALLAKMRSEGEELERKVGPVDGA